MSEPQYTTKLAKTLEGALGLAQNYQHAQLAPTHLAVASLTADEDGSIPLFAQVLTKTGADTVAIERALRKALNQIPSQEPAPAQVGMSAATAKVMKAAHDIMKQQKDTFIAVDHLIAALVQDDKIKSILKANGVADNALKNALDETRGNRRIDSASAEEGFDALKKYSIDFTELARLGKLDPCIGREDEIRRCIRILSRRTKNNPCLIGEPGVGKSAIAEGIAQRVNDRDVPENLQTAKVLSLDIAALVSGASHRGEFEERLKAVMKEIQDSQTPIILFIDEIHLIIGAGQAGSGGMDAANILKPALARGQLHCIGATTLAEYRKYIEKDSAFERRLQTVVVKEPTIPDTISILRGLKEKYEVFHGITISDGAIVAAAQLAGRYLTTRRLPDSAIDLIDEAAAAVRVARESQPEEIDQLERQIRRLAVEIHALEREKDNKAKERLALAREEKQNLEEQLMPLKAKFDSEKARGSELQNAKQRLDELRVKGQDAERRGDLQTAADINYYAIPDLEAQIKVLEKQKAAADQEELHATVLDDKLIPDVVGEQEISEIVARWTGINVNKLRMSEKAKLVQMERHLSQKVVGQPEAVKAVSNAIRLSRAGLSDPNQPASFLFCGASGTGKTLLTKALAEFLFDDVKSIIRVDCSEYSEPHSLARLIGAPPGYVGHDQGGALTEAIRRKPFSIVLFDEIEKAHQQVITVLLQLLDDGRITSGQGVTVDCKNCIVVMTSNLGAQYLLDDSAADARSGKVSARARDQVMGAVRSFFKPEFVNRLGAIVVFNKLRREDIAEIVRHRLAEVQDRLARNGKDLRLQLTDDAIDYLARAGFSQQYGARPLNRLIQRDLLEKLAVLLLKDQIRQGEAVNITYDPDRRRLNIKPNHLGDEGLLDYDGFDGDDDDAEMMDAREPISLRDDDPQEIEELE
ncbi:hypothetical protein PYCC9005_001345 [Savitreella phatthalungensis]